jgi:hypothetical protein
MSVQRRVLALLRAFRMMTALIVMCPGAVVFVAGVFIGWGPQEAKRAWRSIA